MKNYDEKSMYVGQKVLIMGLGLHGGGLETARFFIRRGADVTITDLQTEEKLAPSIKKLEGLPIRYVLGRHDIKDFENADIVVKNPGVPPSSPYLQAAKRIETDISIFLAHSPARLLAITGSKGKSGTASALHWGLDFARKNGARKYGKETLPGKAYLGGNITVSPLTFLDDLHQDDDVVLELSSWQLADLKEKYIEINGEKKQLLRPRIAILTAIMPDHLNWYKDIDISDPMKVYVADKKIIYKGQTKKDLTIAFDDAWGREFLAETPARSMRNADQPLMKEISGGWIEGRKGSGVIRLDSGELIELVPATVLTPGYHQKKNLLSAALALFDLGIESQIIREAMGTFPGIEHRLEYFYESRGIRFYNDTAATIPDAAAASLEAFDSPVILVSGGVDKNLDFSPLVEKSRKAKAIILLDGTEKGTGTQKLKLLLEKEGISYKGPFNSIDEVVIAALKEAQSGDTVLFSPGCASFGLFQNEFDRGRQWKEAVKRLAGD
jgi:UDP-N-acetylmuramoylalanine--D-glutamate ligase